MEQSKAMEYESQKALSDVLKLRYIYIYIFFLGGHTVAQLVEALRYKSEGRGFDSRWCHWNFLLT